MSEYTREQVADILSAVVKKVELGGSFVITKDNCALDALKQAVKELRK